MATDGRLVLFGPEHLVMLAIFAAGCVVAVALGGRVRLRPRLLSAVFIVLGVGIFLCCLPFEVNDLIIGLHHARTSLPLELCDFAWIAAGLALLTRHPRWCALTYFWGLTLCVQAVITPDLGQLFPATQFFGFWLRHLCPVWAAVLLTAARIGPSWRGYRFTLVVTAVWAAVVMSLNLSFGSNYGYLNGKPAGGSVLNLLGPWPWYVVVEVVLAAGVWALLTWPWNRHQEPTPRAHERIPVQ